MCEYVYTQYFAVIYLRSQVYTPFYYAERIFCNVYGPFCYTQPEWGDIIRDFHAWHARDGLLSDNTEKWPENGQ